MTWRNKITRAYVLHYRDNKSTKAYVEWADGAKTEGSVRRTCQCCGRPRENPDGLDPHMAALFARATREGLTIEHEAW